MTRAEAERRVIAAAQEWRAAAVALTKEHPRSLSTNTRLTVAHKALAAAVDSLPDTGEADGWRPIAADPPPEDTEVLVGLWDETGSYIMNDHWSSSGESWVDWHATVHKDDPTHWRPMLPRPLAAAPNTGEG